MAHAIKVIRSVEASDGLRCVDLWITPDSRHGFAECRRDPEDGRGWRPTGLEVGGLGSADAALAAARRDVPWLTELPG